MILQQRLSGEDLYHHIYAWGNNRNHLFSHDHHYTNYLKLLAHFSKRHKIDIIAYALMEWHIHLFIYDKINTMPYFMKELHGVHARYYNYETNRVGHAFGERYNNKIVQPTNYALYLSRYIHRQAVEAGLVQDPRRYEWTSYNRYIGIQPCDFVKPGIVLDQFGDNMPDEEKITQYMDFVQGERDNPVDWDMTNFNIVGDRNFCLYVKRLNREKKKIRIRPHDIISIISMDLAIDGNRLLNPRGREEKALRHKAFKLLVKDYDYTYNEIARLFKVTRLTVGKAIEKRDNMSV